MSEARLWSWLKDVLPLGHYSRIETGDTAPGFPDVYCRFSTENAVTLELKHARRPRDQIPFTEKRGIRKSQVIWIREELRHGGPVWLVLEVAPLVLVLWGGFAPRINGATRDSLKEWATLILEKSSPETAAADLEALLIRGEME